MVMRGVNKMTNDKQIESMAAHIDPTGYYGVSDDTAIEWVKAALAAPPAHAELARVKAEYAERFTAHFDEHVAEYFFNAAMQKVSE